MITLSDVKIIEKDIEKVRTANATLSCPYVNRKLLKHTLCFLHFKKFKYHLIIRGFNGSFFKFITSAEREVKNSRAQECFKVAFGGPEVASKCPKVAAELVRDIFEFFDLFFQGKFVTCRLVWVLT